MTDETQRLREAEARFVRFERRLVLWQLLKFAAQAAAGLAVLWAMWWTLQ